MNITLKTERVTVIEVTSFEPPLWMQYAFNGEKINAIKELRYMMGHAPEGTDRVWKIGLGEAKIIVESVTNGIKTSNQRV